jgi:glycosyltransferase involved in cell wall biosynthesis
MNRAKKTIVIIGALPPPHHGVTVFTKELLESRIASDFDLIHLDTSDKRDLDNMGKLDLENALLALKNIVRLKWLCLTRRPDIVYVPNSQNNVAFLRDGIFILIGKWLCGAKVVMHYHGGESFVEFVRRTNLFMRWFIAFVLKRVDVAIVVGHRLKYLLEKEVRRVEVVPNGSRFQPELNGRWITTRSLIVVSFLSNLFRSKGVLDLMQAAAIVSARYSNVRFRFAGEWWGQEPETKTEAMEIIESKRLRESVEFVGKVLGAEKERFLLDTDIFVFPTWNDSFGLVNLEAMAAGCPVVSTRGVGAIEEVVIDGETGILVEKQNPQQLAEAIIRLIDDPELRVRMGKAGRDRFEKHYTMEKNIEQMINVFNSVLQS